MPGGLAGTHLGGVHQAAVRGLKTKSRGSTNLTSSLSRRVAAAAHTTQAHTRSVLTAYVGRRLLYHCHACEAFDEDPTQRKLGIAPTCPPLFLLYSALPAEIPYVHISFAYYVCRLQVVLYHRHACEAVDEDSLLELADWCVRKLAYLNSGAHKAAAAKGKATTPCGQMPGTAALFGYDHLTRCAPLCY
jgi:hypothetical protein